MYTVIYAWLTSDRCMAVHNTSLVNILAYTGAPALEKFLILCST